MLLFSTNQRLNIVFENNFSMINIVCKICNYRLLIHSMQQRKRRRFRQRVLVLCGHFGPLSMPVRCRFYAFYRILYQWIRRNSKAGTRKNMEQSCFVFVFCFFVFGVTARAVAHGDRRSGPTTITMTSPTAQTDGGLPRSIGLVSPIQWTSSLKNTT